MAAPNWITPPCFQGGARGGGSITIVDISRRQSVPWLTTLTAVVPLHIPAVLRAGPGQPAPVERGLDGCRPVDGGTGVAS